MSLAVLADHMASKGRGPDSMLIHMSPREVQGLQALAMEHGGSLTINPNTGLPEAGFLDKLLPAIIGFALDTFAPGVGTAIGGALGTSAAVGTGIAVGGAQALRTGDIGKGISAGLGAYGGASFGAGLTEAGASTIGAAEAAKGLTMTPELASELQIAGEGAKDTLLQQQVADRMATATPYEKLSSGVDAFKNNPMGMTKSLAMPAFTAAAPVLADQAVKSNLPTTTTRPGMLRPYSYDPYGGSYTAGTPYEAIPTRAAGGGLMGMDDGGYSPGQLDFTQKSEPVVRMAEGGIAGYALGGDIKSQIEAAYAANDIAKINELASANKITAGDISDTYKGFDTSGVKGLQLYTPPAAPTYTQYTPEQMGSFLSNPVNKDIDIGQATKDTNADPAAVNRYIASLTSPFVGSTDTTGGSGTLGIYNNMVAKGVDPTEYYKAALASNPSYGGWNQDMIQKGYNLDKGAYALTDQIARDKIAADPKLGYDKQWVKFMDDNKYTIDDMAQAFGISKNEVQRRYDAAKKVDKVVTAGTGTGTTIIPGVNDYGLGGNGTSGALESVYGPALPPGVSGAGITTVNPNGTITTRPNIPGIPEGGFTGMTDVRNAYTKGGGSLGYVPYAPKTIDEFNAKYKNTGGSKAAYDYLMGKTPYSPVPYTATGEIMKPYFESVGKAPVNLATKKYVFVNGKYELNPAYVKPSYVLAGEDGKIDPTKVAEQTAVDEQANFDYAAYLKANPDVQAELDRGVANFGTKDDLAAAAWQHYLRYGKSGGRAYTKKAKEGGLMALADGGITGNGQLNLNIPLNLGGNSGYGGGSSVSNLFSGGAGGGYQTQNNQNSVQQSGMPDFRNQIQGLDAQIQKLPSMMAYNDYGKSISGRPPTADEMAQMEQLRKGFMGDQGFMDLQSQIQGVSNKYQQQAMGNQSLGLQQRYAQQSPTMPRYASGGMAAGGQFDLGGYSDGGRLLRGPGDGVSDSIPATIGNKRPARLADGEFVVPARIVSELGNGSTEAGARKLYAMMDRVQAARKGSIGKGRVANNSRADKYLPA